MAFSYFLKADPGDDVENGYAVLLRLEAGAPWAGGEALHADGVWEPDDDLVAYHLRGSNSVDINEIDAARAREIMLARHANGWFSALPDPLPADAATDEAIRSDVEQAARQEQWETGARAQTEALRRYAAVPVPPGVQDIEKPIGDAGRAVHEHSSDIQYYSGTTTWNG